MRAVIDTNVLVAGLLWHGPSHALLAHARNGVIRMVSSPALLAELADVLGRTKLATAFARAETSRDKALAEMVKLLEFVEPVPLAQPVCRDPDDDEVLALSITARVELIVSGDADLLSLQAFEGIPILDPAQALARLGRDIASS